MERKETAADGAAAGATKQRIVDTAIQLFARKGYAAASIADICREVPCSKGAVYHHFTSKEDLFVYITEQTFTASWERWSAIAAGYTTIVDKLYAFSEHFVDTMQRPLSKAAEEFLKNAAGDEARVKFGAIVMGFMANFESFIREGVESGELKQQDPRELAFLILSFYSGLSDSYAFMPKEELKPLFRNATSLLLDGIRRT
ncbi:TetR/AcrR family transcriptional regulator [Paenibacillus kobensis]|uniref:TetR/AcrR family transcriptional regulator n=1 Tax=Paenibacillus kobensis TaxID=59841 RepID=UPI000FD9385C|nr:TetR/AcrR family transcriptional regulator [Paenibacillus kobensis]